MYTFVYFDHIECRVSVEKEFINQERDHYNEKVSKFTSGNESAQEVYLRMISDWEDGPFQSPYHHLVEQVIEKSKGKETLLDYCAGHGIHSVKIQKVVPYIKIESVDISDESVKFGEFLNKSIETENVPNFQVMDAHKLKFPQESFDIVLNFGSFSSLNFNQSVQEIKKVLRSGGYLINLETFGHNPLTNLKRYINQLLGKRTTHATSNIMKIDNILALKKEFTQVDVHYYLLFSLALFVFKKPHKTLVKFFNSVDQLLFKFFPFLRKYAFKILVIAKK